MVSKKVEHIVFSKTKIKKNLFNLFLYFSLLQKMKSTKCNKSAIKQKQKQKKRN